MEEYFDDKKHSSGCPIEDMYLNDARKQSRQKRKLISTRDSSKYKKTNVKQLKKSSGMYTSRKDEGTFYQGCVISIQGLEIHVCCEDKIYTCVLKGLLKRDKVRLKNIVTVGDFVLFEKLTEKEGVIIKIEERRSFLSRADNMSRKNEQLIASNIDQVLITASVVEPAFKPNLIDRYIIAARKGNMTPVIIINKIDLLPADRTFSQERLIYEEFIDAFAKINIKVLTVSTVTGEGIDELREIMTKKVSVFAGQSGVGKSSLINIITCSNLATRRTLRKTGKGSHTTTTACLMQLDFGGWCIDTPGIKSFGIWQVEPSEVEQYFPDIYEYRHLCKYPNCSHLHEPDCAVQKAVELGDLHQLRLNSYRSFMTTAFEKHLHR